MNLTVIGHGNVGGALAKKLALAGHQITIGARNPESERLAPLKKQIPNLKITDIPTSTSDADAILIAIPAHLTVALAEQLGDLSGKVVIDTTNSVFKRPEPYRTGFEAFQKICKAEVAKCFNSTGFENMENPKIVVEKPSPHEVALDMMVAGDSEKAKKIAMQLAEEIGFISHDFGGDDKVELLESFAMAWINLAIMQGMGRGIGFKLLRRSN